jgi:hypothetical protein
MASVVRAGPHGPTHDGVCACALAFSTLLSSQGADAHPRRPVSLVRGNPANLPAVKASVKQLPEAFTDPANPACADHDLTPARKIRDRHVVGGSLRCPTGGHLEASQPFGARRNTRQPRRSSQISWRVPAAQFHGFRRLSSRVAALSRRVPAAEFAGCGAEQAGSGGEQGRAPAQDGRARTPAIVRLPRRSTRNCPCSRSARDGAASGEVTFSLLR